MLNSRDATCGNFRKEINRLLDHQFKKGIMDECYHSLFQMSGYHDFTGEQGEREFPGIIAILPVNPSIIPTGRQFSFLEFTARLYFAIYGLSANIESITWGTRALGSGPPGYI
jgi:hypothetical protein